MAKFLLVLGALGVLFSLRICAPGSWQMYPRGSPAAAAAAAPRWSADAAAADAPKAARWGGAALILAISAACLGIPIAGFSASQRDPSTAARPATAVTFCGAPLAAPLAVKNMGAKSAAAKSAAGTAPPSSPRAADSTAPPGFPGQLVSPAERPLPHPKRVCWPRVPGRCPAIVPMLAYLPRPSLSLSVPPP